MGRSAREQSSGGVVHVTARGVRRLPIFVDDDDRRMFMAFFAQAIHRRQWSCLAYCLMPNHYHAIIRLTQPNLSVGMHRLNWLYASRFNVRHGHVGHLFDARFHSSLLETDEHLFNGLSYVVLNPVRAGLCADPADWKWSSFRATAGLERCPSYLAGSRVRKLFAPGRGGAELYATFVRDRIELSATA